MSATGDLDDLQTRRIAVFLGVAFGLSWATGAAVYLTGGLTDSPTLLAGISLATVLVAGPYMWAPAVANVVARLATGEGWTDLLLRPRLPEGWRAWLVAWLLPVALVLAGGAVYFAAFPDSFGGLAAVGDLLDRLGEVAGQPLPFDPGTYVALQFALGVVLSPFVNAPFTFGEEFGWRAYLLPKLAPLGWRRALVAHGVVWGVWHWPVIAMGHNYGLGYAGAPYAGMATMVLFTVAVGVVLGWVTLRGGSVWPAVVGHAVVNGFAGFPALFFAGDPTPLLGPTGVGLVAMLPWLAVAGWLLASPERLAPVAPVAEATG